MASRHPVLRGVQGVRLGRTEDILTDPDTGEPTWALVSVARHSPPAVVPVTGARRTGGHDLWVPFDLPDVRSAPRSAEPGPLEFASALAHFGLAEAPARAPRRWDRVRSAVLWTLVASGVLGGLRR